MLDTAFEGLREATESELDKELADFFNRHLKEQRERRKDHPFWDFRLPLEPDRRFYNASIKRKDKDQWITMGYDNWDPWEVNIYASDYGRIIGYPSEETRNSGIDPYEIETRVDPDARLYGLTAVKGTIELGLEDISEYHVVYRDGVEASFRRRDVGGFDFSFSTGFNGSFWKEPDDSYTLKFKGELLEPTEEAARSRSKFIVSRSKYSGYLLLILEEDATVSLI